MFLPVLRGAYSTDLRTKIVAAVDGGLRKSEAARVFRMGISTIKRYAQQRRQTGSDAAAGGRCAC